MRWSLRREALFNVDLKVHGSTEEVYLFYRLRRQQQERVTQTELLIRLHLQILQSAVVVVHGLNCTFSVAKCDRHSKGQNAGVLFCNGGRSVSPGFFKTRCDENSGPKKTQVFTQYQFKFVRFP